MVFSRVAEVLEALKAGKVDVFATNKAALYQMADLIPGSRVLPGRWGVERSAGLSCIKAYAEDVTDKRFLALTVERAGLRGVIAAQ